MFKCSVCQLHLLIFWVFVLARPYFCGVLSFRFWLTLLFLLLVHSRFTEFWFMKQLWTTRRLFLLRNSYHTPLKRREKRFTLYQETDRETEQEQNIRTREQDTRFLTQLHPLTRVLFWARNCLPKSTRPEVARKYSPTSKSLQCFSWFHSVPLL